MVVNSLLRRLVYFFMIEVLLFASLFCLRRIAPTAPIFDQILLLSIGSLALYLLVSNLPLGSSRYLKRIHSFFVITVLVFMLLAQASLVNIDRSRSFYVLSWVKLQKVQLVDSSFDMSKVISDEKLIPSAIQERLNEHIDRNFIILDSSGKYQLTTLGEYSYQIAQILSDLYLLSGWDQNKN